MNRFYKEIDKEKFPEATQIYAQINMATKTNSNGKENKKEAEELVIELEKDNSTLDPNNDGLQQNLSTNTDPLDKCAELCAKNNEDNCSSIDKQEVRDDISSPSENQNHGKKQSNVQSTETDTKTIISKFDDYFSDADVEYL